MGPGVLTVEVSPSTLSSISSGDRCAYHGLLMVAFPFVPSTLTPTSSGLNMPQSKTATDRSPKLMVAAKA